MCDFGISALVTSIVASAFSTTMGVVSSVQQGKAEEAQYQAQAQVAKNNAKIAQANAEQKNQEGIEEARLTRMKTIQKIGAQQAAMAANGIDVTSGSALDMIGDTASWGEYDALTTRYNYGTQARAYNQQAQNFNNQAEIDLISGQNARSAARTQAIGTALNGLGDMASVSAKWYGNNKTDNNTKPKKVKNNLASGGLYGDELGWAV